MKFAFFYLLAFTGLRKGEAFALTWDDVDFSNRTISVSKTLTHEEDNKFLVNTTKKKQEKALLVLISIDFELVKVLTVWKEDQSTKVDFYEFRRWVFTSNQYKNLVKKHF